MDQIKIQSAKGDLALIIEWHEQPKGSVDLDYAMTSLVGTGVNASIKLYDFYDTFGVTLWGFFEFMNLHKEGWQGEHIRRSLEDELVLIGTIDKLGKIEVRVILNQNSSTSYWKMEGTLYLYHSQLPEIINQIRRTYNGDW